MMHILETDFRTVKSELNAPGYVSNYQDIRSSQEVHNTGVKVHAGIREGQI